MKFKRLATLALAGAMSLSLAAPAFASGNTEVTATYTQPVISVTVPTKGAVAINPYGLDVEMAQDPNDDTNTNKVTISGHKIVTAPMALKNKTKMNLAVNVTMTGVIKTGSDMRLTTEALAADDTSKSAYVYLQATPSALTGADTAVTAAAIGTEFAAWEAAAYDAEKDLLLDIRAASKDKIVTLKAAKMNASTGAFDEYNAGSIALVRLAGDVVASPRSPWAATDGFTANIAYTFMPTQIATYTITEGTKTVASGSSANAATAMAIKVGGAAATKAAAGDTVSVDVTVDAAVDQIDWTVVDTEGNAIAGLAGNVPAAAGTTRSFTFTMPAQPVTVNVVSK